MNLSTSMSSWTGPSDVEEAKDPLQHGLENGANGDEKKEVIPENITSQNDVTQSLFDIIASRTIDEESEPIKKYVLYTVRVRHGTANVDHCVTFIERRYTDFLNLYDELKRDFPEKIATFSFPGKAIMGNFSLKLINERTKSFQKFLNFIVEDFQMKNSPALLAFLQNRELQEALKLYNDRRFDEAEPLLTNNFRLLNKVFTDRSHAVIIALCRVVSCCTLSPTLRPTRAAGWANLAVQRYDGVSDADLLSLYGPLLETAIELLPDDDERKAMLVTRLADLRRRGMRLESCTLFEAVDKLDKTLQKSAVLL